MSALIDAVRKRCKEKPGAKVSQLSDNEYDILNSDLSLYARLFPDESPPVLLCRCHDAVRDRLAKMSPAVCRSKRMGWTTQGWAWTDVPLDGSVPAPDLLSLVDDSYQIAYDKLFDFQKKRVERLSAKLKPDDLFAQLLESHGLGKRRAEIEAMARPALLLKTTAAKDADIPVGASKIGGDPDLPAGIEWPTHKDGKPLAFLAQIDLGQAAKALKLPGLPTSGLLSIFSVFGWQEAGDSDPHVPPGKQTPDWTRVIHSPGRKKPTRHKAPAEVNSFKSAKVEFVPTVCYPTHPKEPAVARHKWKSDVKEKFDDFVGDWKAATLNPLGDPPRNLLGGYADYEQDFVKEVATGELVLLFQLASDDAAEMMWGDGGYLYFWIAPADLEKGNFDKILADCQGG